MDGVYLKVIAATSALATQPIDWPAALTKPEAFILVPLLANLASGLRIVLALLVALLYGLYLNRERLTRIYDNYQRKRAEKKAAAQSASAAGGTAPAETKSDPAPKEDYIPQSSYRRDFRGQFFDHILLGIVAFSVFALLTGHVLLNLFIVWNVMVAGTRLVLSLVYSLLYSDEKTRAKLDYVKPLYNFLTEEQEYRRLPKFLRPLARFVDGNIGIAVETAPALSMAAAALWCVFDKGDPGILANAFAVTVLVLIVPGLIASLGYLAAIIGLAASDNIDGQIRFYKAFHILYLTPLFLTFIWLPLMCFPAIVGTLDAKDVLPIVSAVPMALILVSTLLGAYRHYLHAKALMKARLDIVDDLLVGLEIPPEIRGVREMSKQRLFDELGTSMHRGVYRFYFLYLLLTYYGLDVFLNLLRYGLSPIFKYAGVAEISALPDEETRDDAVKKLAARFNLMPDDFAEIMKVFDRFSAAFISLVEKGAYLEQWDIYCAHIHDLFFMFMAYPGNDPHRIYAHDEPSEAHTRTALMALAEKIKRHKSEQEGFFAPATLFAALGAAWTLLTHLISK